MIIGIFALLVFLASVFDIYLEVEKYLQSFDMKKVNPEIEMNSQGEEKPQDVTKKDSSEKEKPLEISK